MARKFLSILILMILACPLLADITDADQDIKARMKARLSLIASLKADGVIGENNGGFLEFRGKQREKADVVNEENNDRGIVYKAIAKQQGTTVEVVGKIRAKQIAKKAKPGEWLQSPEGEWYRK